MSDDNRFKDCETAEGVLLSYSQIYDQNPQTRADALARIAELTPRTVTDDQWKRAISAAIDYRSRPAYVLVDRIIDALGWTAAEPERHQCADVQDDCCERTPAPATPAVELDAQTVESLASLAKWYGKALRGFDQVVVKIDDTEAVIVRSGYNTVRVQIRAGDE